MDNISSSCGQIALISLYYMLYNIINAVLITSDAFKAQNLPDLFNLSYLFKYNVIDLVQ